MRNHFLFFLLFLVCATVEAQNNISGIINDYAAVTDVNVDAVCGFNEITVDDASAFSIGDSILIIQMQGATIGTGNNAAYGDITSLNSAGRYEKNSILSIVGNTITLDVVPVNAYDVAGSVQIIRIPYYTGNVNVVAPLTAAPWNGSIGGVVIFSTSGTVNLMDNIDVSGLGFRGGVNSLTAGNSCAWFLTRDQYFNPLISDLGAGKGEGIASFVVGMEGGRGKQANGGGAGNDHNAGGAGGGNAGLGGNGGINDEPGTFNCHGDFPGIGGLALPYTSTIFLGGGGGAGHGNNNGYTAGSGGGIVVIKAQDITSSGGEIRANGTTQIGASDNDGACGGGAGGCVALELTDFTLASAVTIEAHGADGNNSVNINNRCYGPGGGGGGGAILTNAPITYATHTVNAGTNGIVTASTNACNGSTLGAAPGAIGINTNGFAMPQSNTAGPTPSLVDPGVLNQPTICIGSPYIYTANSINTTGFQWQIDSNGMWVDIVDDVTNFTGSNSASLTIQSVTANYATDSLRVLVYNSCDSAFSNGQVFIVNEAPTIDVQPSNALACIGGETFLTFEQTGGTSIQWFSNLLGPFLPLSNGPNFSGVTTDSLHITGVNASMVGPIFRAQVTNSCGPAFTSFVSISLVTSTSINNASAGFTVCEGGDAELFVSSDFATDTYVWEVNTGSGFFPLTNDVIHSGVNNDTLQLTNVPLASGGDIYRVIVSDQCGSSITSSNMLATVTSLPNLAMFADTQQVCESTPVFITSALTSGVASSFIWQIDSSGVWQDLMDDVTFSNTTGNFIGVLSNGGLNLDSLRVIATNSCGSDTSNALVLAVNSQGNIITHPQDAQICVGDDVSLNINADNIVSYQWQSDVSGTMQDLSNDATLSGVNTANLDINSFPGLWLGSNFRVVMTDECGFTVTSNTSTVSALPVPVITNTSSAVSLCGTTDALLFVETNGSESGYLWQVDMGAGFVNQMNDLNHSGANTDSLIATLSLTSDGFVYRCIIINNCSESDTSALINISVGSEITVNALPIIACDSAIVASATYTSSQILTDTFLSSQGCDSIYNQPLIINNTVVVNNMAINTCDSAVVNGNTYTSSQMVMDTFTAFNGCDSIEITDVTINNSVIINNPAVIACDSAIINGTTYFTSQMVTDTFMTTTMCDSIEITDLTINNAVSTISAPLVVCDSAVLNGSVYFTSQSVVDTFTTGFGCDSIVTTMVTVNNSTVVNNPAVVACDSASINGNTYTSSQMVMDTFTSSNGCDSIEITDLTINNTEVINNNAIVACDSAIVNGTVYTMSQFVMDTFTNSNGCDSIEVTQVFITTTLIVNNLPVVACDSAQINGNWYFASQTVVDTFSAASACDSVELTIVTINNSTSVTNPTITSCDSVLLNGTAYFTSQTVVETLTGTNGCDSISVTPIVINSPITINNPAIDACDSAVINGTTYFTTQVVMDTFMTSAMCDSIEITDLTVNNSVATFVTPIITCDSAIINGTTYFNTQIVVDTLTTSSGCDSIVTTDLTINNSVVVNNLAVMACDSAIINGNTYTVSQTVVDTFSTLSGCDSIEITPLTINNSIIVNNPAVIACDSASINGVVYFVSQIVTDSFLTTALCDSIEITDLTINNSTSITAMAIVACDSAVVNGGTYFATQLVIDTLTTSSGCDSIVTTDLTINNSVLVNNAPIIACDSAIVNGNTYTSSQMVMDTFTTSNGCDSIEITPVTINTDIFVNNLPVVACDSAVINGSTYFTSQLVLDTFVSSVMCDSIEITDLIINNSTTVMAAAIVVCDSAVINGITYTTSQLVTDTLATVNGCDSIVTTDVTINNSVIINNPAISACDSVMVNGNTYMLSQMVMDTFTAASGCDSIEITPITINNSITVNSPAVIACDSALINGMLYFTSQMVMDTFMTTAMCDSIVVTDLTINNSASSNAPSIVACDSAVVNGTTYFASQLVIDTLMTLNGCDSIVTTDITINNSVVVNNAAVMACDSAIVNGNIYFTSQIVMDTFIATSGCDSIEITPITINNSSNTIMAAVIACDSAFVNGNWYFTTQTVVDSLTSASGCDSIISTDLTINNTVTVPTSSIITCDSALIDGTMYFSSQIVNYTHPGNGSTVCDSLFTVDLIINNTTIMPTIFRTACDMITVDGTTYNSSQVVDSIVAGNGSNLCDTIFPIDITILNTVVIPVQSITSCDSVLVNGTFYSSNQTVNYTVPGNGITTCDSVFNVNVIIQEPITISQSDDIVQCGGFNVEIFVEPSMATSIQWQIDTGFGFIDVVESSMANGMIYTGANSDTLTIVNINVDLSGAIVQAVVASSCAPAPIFDPVSITINEPMELTNTLEDFTVCLREVEPVFVDYVSDVADWNTGDFGQYFVPTYSGDYFVTFLDNNACPQMDTINVTIEDCLARCFVTAPTGFSPNGSNTNDVFRAIYGCDIEMFELKVFNRWGEIIFATTNPEEGWDGTFKGVQAEIGTYSWSIVYRKSDTFEVNKINGNVTLIR